MDAIHAFGHNGMSVHGAIMSNLPSVNTDGRIPSYNPVNGISGVMPEIFHTFIMLINL